jgi:hypothetical protein
VVVIYQGFDFNMRGKTSAIFNRTRLLLVAVLAILLGTTAIASTPTMQSHGDILAYHAAGLLNPVVIYAYDAKGSLLRVFGADGDNGFSGMEKVRAAVASGTLDSATEVTSDMDAKLRGFLASQGLKSENVTGGGTPYRLIPVVPDTGGAPCPPCENYRAMLADAMGRPAASNRFSVYTLKLGAPGSVFRVVK